MTVGEKGDRQDFHRAGSAAAGAELAITGVTSDPTAPSVRISQMKRALTWLAILVVFQALDAMWLGVFAGSLYTDALGGLMAARFRIVPAVLFYLLYITGIVVFVLPRARRAANLWVAFAFGAFFGTVAYGTYDLTNQAVLAVWTSRLTIIDMAWGAFVTAAGSLAGAWVERRLTRR